MACRVERDLIGTKKIPADAYYGIHTARAAGYGVGVAQLALSFQNHLVKKLRGRRSFLKGLLLFPC